MAKHTPLAEPRTALQIACEVDRGIVLVSEIAARQKELKELTKRLEKDALAGDQVDLIDSEREGKQFLAKGSEKTIPIVITADTIVGSFQDKSAVHERICAAFFQATKGDDRNIECDITEFFVPTTTFQNLFDSGKQFRAHAAHILGNAAPPFITACVARDKHGIPKNAVKIDWDRAEKQTPDQPAK